MKQLAIHFSAKQAMRLFLLSSLSLLASCGGVYDSNCDGTAGKIHTALSNKNEQDALKLIHSLKNVKNLSATCERHTTPLLVSAAENGYTELVAALLDKGVNINQKDKRGRTALMRAIQRQHLSVVKCLAKAYSIKEKAREMDEKGSENKTALIDEKVPRGKKTALMFAVMSGNLDIVKCLVEAGANIDEKGSIDNDTSLILATKQDKSEVAKYLIHKRAKVDEQSDSGTTALMCAARSGNLEVIQLLLKRRANVNIQDHFGTTALMDAIESDKAKGNLVLFKKLIKHSDLSLKDEDGRTALSYLHDRIKDLIDDSKPKKDIDFYRGVMSLMR